MLISHFALFLSFFIQELLWKFLCILEEYKIKSKMCVCVVIFKFYTFAKKLLISMKKKDINVLYSDGIQYPLLLIYRDT